MKKYTSFKILMVCAALALVRVTAYAQITAADEPGAATVVLVKNTCTYTTYTNVNATRTTSVPQPAGGGCAGWGAGATQGRDVWFRIQVPGNGIVTVTLDQGTLTDCVMAIYTGPNASSLTLLGCDDDSGPGSMPQMSVSGQTPGSYIWVRVWDLNSNDQGTFELCAQTNIPTAQDCLGALPICQAIYSTTQSYTNSGNILNEINATTSCLKDGEKNDVWYTFSVQQSGDLAFDITPFNLANDYDWAVYNLTTNNCQDIFSQTGMQVSCNFSSTPGVTGTNNSSFSNSQPALGTKFNAVIPVVKDEVYVINISNYSSSQAGYTIDFTNSTANIYDTVKPRLKVIDVLPESCGSEIEFTMTENVTCATTSGADFKITGPTGIVHTGTAISSLNCDVGAGYDRTFTLVFAPPLTESGTFTLSLTSTAGNVTDLCGNVSNPNSTSLTFQLDTPTISISAQPVNCFGGNNGTATVSVVNPNSTPAYIWSNGATTAGITGLTAGTYTVTVTVGLCTKVLSTVVTQPAAAITATVSSTDEVCGKSNGTATVAVANATGAVSYIWSNGQTNATANGLVANTYLVTVTDSRGCTATGTTVVGVNNSFFTTTTKGDTSCLSGAGTAYVTIAGGAAPYTYLWNNGATNDSIINAANGSYTVTITDNNGCTATANTGIFRKPLIQLNPGNSTAATCGVANGTATVNPSAGGGGFGYVWSNTQTTKSIANLMAGKYYVTITDANSCTTTDSVSVPQTGAPVINNVAGTAPLCYAGTNGSATINATGNAPLTYLWSNGQQTVTANNLDTGYYSVTVTDVNGCTGTSGTTITQPDSIGISPVSSTNVTCFGGNNGAINTTATGGTGALSYNWSNGQNTANATALTAATYILTVRDANNCTNTRGYVITEPTAVVANAGNDTTIATGNSTSIGGMPTGIGGTGPYTYAWSPATFLDATNTEHPTATPTIGTSYCVTVTDASNCSTTDCITVNIAEYPIADAGRDTTICKGSTVIIGGGPTARGGTPSYTYEWQPANLLENNTMDNPKTLALNTSTDFTVVVTDNFGLKDTDVVAVSVIPEVVVTLQPTDALCFGEASAQIAASATGGNAPYSYNWSNTSINSILTGVIAGTYDLTVTDASNCVVVSTVSVGQAAQLVVGINTVKAFCFGQASGSATASVSGGTAPYTYLWSDGQASATAINLNAGNHTVTITDAHSCTTVASGTVGEENQLQLSSNTAALTCTYNTDGKILMSATGGVTPYQYEIYKPNQPITTSISGDFNALDSGFYYIRVRDKNNCLTFDSVALAPAVPDEVMLEEKPASCYGLEYKDGSITITATTTNNGPYTYLINGGAENATGEFKGLGYGRYELRAVNAIGCVLDTFAFVDRPAPLVASIVPDTVTLALGSSAVLQVVDNGANPVYAWSPIEGLSCVDCASPTVTVYNEQEFTVKVSDIISTGAVCSTKASILVKVEKPLPVFVPNMFSPNADGANDVFSIYGNNIREINMRIFNRWGEQVYQSANPNEGWNGDFKGSKQAPGVYVYIADIIFLDNSKVFKQGSVTLTR